MKYTENLQILLDDMYLCSRDYEVEECNSLMLIAALMDIDAFSAALEAASELDSIAIEDCFDIIVEHAEFMESDKIEILGSKFPCSAISEVLASS